MFAPKNILVPTDFSEHSDRALKQAVDLAVQNKAKIYLLHVVEGIQRCAIDYCLEEDVVRRVELDSAEASRKKMKEEIDRISKQRGVDIVFDIKIGNPYETILKEQEDKKADLIVIASHGKTGLLKHLIGSVAEKVTRSAKCPVLLVK